MNKIPSINSPKNSSFFIIPQDSFKPHTLQLRAYKYINHLDIDSQFVNDTKTKKKYIKQIFRIRLQITKPFEQSYSLALMKKQKCFKSIMDAYGYSVHVFAKLLKRRKVKRVICPYIQTEKKFIRFLQKSSSLRKNLSHVGLVLKAERQGNLLSQLYRCRVLSSLSLFFFGSTNMLNEDSITKGFNITSLKVFRVIFVWINKLLLSNITQLLATNPLIRELNINVLEWKNVEKDAEFYPFMQAIGSLQHLTDLGLSTVTLNSEDTNILLDSVSQLKNLKYLRLGIQEFTIKQYANLQNLCEQLQGLRELNLELNQLSLHPDFFKYLNMLKCLTVLYLRINFEEELAPSLEEFRNFFISHPMLKSFSFEAYKAPNLQESSFSTMFSYLKYCPNLRFVDVRVRQFAEKNKELTIFNDFGETLSGLSNLQDLYLNFHLWYPIKSDMSKLAQTLTRLVGLKILTIHFPLMEGNSTQTLKSFRDSIVNLKELRSLKIEFCIDEPLNLETELFNVLLDGLPKLKELSLSYHDLNKANNELVSPFSHLEKIAVQKYQVTSFILSNVLVYTYEQNEDSKKITNT